jgi:hypothetical protein
MAFSGGHDWDTIMNTLHGYVVAGSGLLPTQVIWAQQDAPRPEEPAIIMKLSVFDDVGMPWLDHESNPHTFADIAIASLDATTNSFTSNAHGRLTGDGPVRVETTGTLPAELSTTQDYWVITVDANTFKLAVNLQDALNGVAVDFSPGGSGTHTLVDTPATLRVGEEIKFLSRALVHATLTLECYTGVGVGMDMATSLLNRVRSRAGLPSQKERLDDANIGLSGYDRVFALEGHRDAFLFEPRASMDVQLNLPSEESEVGRIIESAEITNQSTTNTWVVEP